MRTAQRCGIPAAKVSYVFFEDEPALVVERYDRLANRSGAIVRLHQEDCCQALGCMPGQKYTKDGGPKTADLLRLLASTSEADINLNLFTRMLFFNCVIGAPDTHAKNYSLLLGVGGRALLAKMYDVASGLCYDELRRKGRLAMAIGEEHRFGRVGRGAIARYAGKNDPKTATIMKRAGLDEQACADILANLARRVPVAMEEVFNEECSLTGIEELRSRLLPQVGYVCERTLAGLSAVRRAWRTRARAERTRPDWPPDTQPHPQCGEILTQRHAPQITDRLVPTVNTPQTRGKQPMVEHKLANILLEHNERFFQYPNLFYHSANEIIEGEAGESLLMRDSTYDFATYFNSCSIAKWREYTVVTDVHLHLEIRGKARITFFTLREQPVGVGMTRLESIDIDCDDYEVVDYTFTVEATGDDTLATFKITTLDSVAIKNGYYYAMVDEADVRGVHLAIATTTFKKEAFITRNVALFKNEVLSGDDPCAGHASMIVVDNGRTLDPSELEGDGVWVFPNKNVGGSGGFARGMMEAKRLSTDEPVTHVLIMDDDVSLSSESVKRTFNLVSLVNDKYAEGFVSGAMFSLGDQYVQIEDVGFTSQEGRFGPIKLRAPMINYFEIVRNERPLPPYENKYAAFWYCCIPMATVEREGLPLPLFIRYDDAEYGQRCAPEFMTMNGINVWHEDFDDRYNPYYERYCGVRNSLVIQSASGVCPRVDFYKQIFLKGFDIEIKQFNYGACELMLDALEDYLKGPEFLQIEQCEKLLKEKSAKAEKYVPIEQLDTRGVDLKNVLPKGRVRAWEGRLDRWTHNGQRFLPRVFVKHDPTGVEFNANRYPIQLVHFRDSFLVVNRLGTQGALRRMNKVRYRELMKRYHTLTRRYAKEQETVAASWQEAGPYLKSDEFWATYLELDKYTHESE